MIVLMLIALGLILGSFVNAFVWRLHEHKDWINDRSECSHCHHKLGALDLIPVVSWVWLRGRCRYCHKKIEDNPLVELTLPILFAGSYYFWPLAFSGKGLVEFMFWLVFLVGFLALAVYDLRWFLLPDKVVFPLAGLALIQTLVVTVYDRNWFDLLGACVGVAVISGIFYILFQVSNGTWIGGGDVKLGLVLGLLAGGLLQGFLVLFAASLTGLLATVPFMVQGKAHRKMQIPFGPFLILGLILVKLFGTAVISWYNGLFYA